MGQTCSTHEGNERFVQNFNWQALIKKRRITRSRWVNNIKMDPKDTWWKTVNWILLGYDRDRWWVSVNMVINLPEGTISFLRTLIHGVVTQFAGVTVLIEKRNHKTKTQTNI